MSIPGFDPSSVFNRRTIIRAASVGGIAFGSVGIMRELSASSQSVATPVASPTMGHHGAAAAGTPSGLADLPSLEPVSGEPLRTVETIESVDGVLDVSLRASISETTVAGKTVKTANFNGQFPGPTWVAKPGDTIRLHLTNDLDEITNLHTHGFHVSPQNNGDNVFLQIEPGSTFDYEYQLPDTHPSGVYWYHPHPHGITERQNTSGMVGTILITGGLDEVPGVQGLTQQHLFLQLNQFADTGDQVPITEQTPDKQIRLVNGQYQPTISIRPGETQRWSFSNATSNDYFLLSLAGHRLNQIAKDGNPFAAVVTQESVLLAPAERVEVLIQALATPGTYELRTLQWGVADQAEPDVLLATMVIAGDPMPVSNLPAQLIPFSDLRDLPLDNERVLVFAAAPVPYFQLIDNRPFDPDYVNQTIKLGTLEKWTIQNTTTDIHPFHIHINDFQVISINGEPYEAPGLFDTVNVPAGGEIEILHRFEDFTGKFVYHCHILLHEDSGMMAVVEVVP